MIKVTNKLFLPVLIAIMLIIASCDKEENEPRTREREMAELDLKIKSLEANGIDIDTTNMLVYYHITKPGDGPFPRTGDSCLVSYIGFLPSGKKLEDSDDIHPPDGIWRFIFKPPHKVIGLTNGLGYMNEGAEIEMFITSDNAYGSNGTSTVPPYTTLIYRAKMHEIIQHD